MNIKSKLVSTLIVLILTSGFFGVISPSSAQETELKILNPILGTNQFVFTTDTTHVGDTFEAEVWVFSVTDLFGWQLNVTFDNTMLNVVDIYLPADNIFAGKTTLPAAKTIDNDAGYVLWGVSLGPGESPVSGDGKLCTIQFEIIAEPERKETLSCLLHIDQEGIFYTQLLDPSATEIPFIPTDGEYSFSWAPPTTTPYLELVPNVVKLASGNEKLDLPYAFDVEVWIRNLDPEWQLVGIQFVIEDFNATLMPCVGVDEGPFLQSYAFPEYGTQFIFYDDSVGDQGKLTIGILIYPNMGVTPPTYEGLPNGFPSGDGLVCTLHFNLTEQKEFPWTAECPINIKPLFGNAFMDSDGDWISFDPADFVSSYLIVYGYVLGRQLDLYTEYYYEYLWMGEEDAKELGGVGKNKPSDAFAPQEEVTLYAKLTYNLDPVQNKTVTFQIVRPDGTTIAVLQAVTDADGIATVSFRIPWPCANPEETIFGNWTVYATCDVAEEVVPDTLQFRVGWLIEIVSAKTVETDYTKFEHVTFTLTVKSISKIQRWALITITVTDDLNVPIDMIAQWKKFGGAELLGETTVTFNMTCLWIPKWAFIGTATAHIQALTDWPANGGTAYFKPEGLNELTTTFRIVRPPSP